MKIRHPELIKLFGLLVAWLVRLWMGTLNYRYRPMNPSNDPHHPACKGHYIFAFWHENILVPACFHAQRNIAVLISQHADGRLIAEACRHLGFKTVAGSTTRGSVEAMRQMVRWARHGHLVVTPDGPRGPRRHLQPGLVYLAAKTGLPIVPAGLAYGKAWRLKTWDRFVLPCPWSDAALVLGQPIPVPENLDRKQLEEYRQRVEEAMSRATEAAERQLRREKPERPEVLSQPDAPLAA
jgi:lysophospholipid acyltransferase (LPLAT)-like uncharacterized protein